MGGGNSCVCGIVKMNVMPRLLYHFQSLPIQVPTSFPKVVNRVLVHIVWVRIPHGRHKQVLRLPKLKGGIDLPDAILYHTHVT